MNHVIYKLCQNCKIIDGVGRCCIYDLQRQKYFPIPDTMKMVFNESSEIDLFNLQQSFPDIEEQQIIAEYLQFLLLNDLIIEINPEERSLFPDLDTSWYFPSHISNCLIDANDEISWFNQAFINQLDSLCCHYVQVRFFQEIPLTHLQALLSGLEHSTVKLIDFVLPEKNNKSFYSEVDKLVQSSKKIRSVTIHSSKENALIHQEKFGLGVIISTRQSIDCATHCGVVHPSYFSINLPHYTESLRHNTCLNRKISIDTEGNIKNCPSMKESFGNIRDTTLMEALNKPGFKKYWNISKDQISVCKDCEFRHVCTDCRAYVENPDDDYSKPLKCGYNPYTCEWEEWSTHPMKQAAISHYGIPK